MPRIDESTVSPEEFIEKYEKPYLPIVIKGSQDEWRAKYKWTLEVSLKFSLWFLAYDNSITSRWDLKVLCSGVL